MRSSNLRDGFFFFGEFSDHLSLERRCVVFLFGHSVRCDTGEGLPDRPNFGVRYKATIAKSKSPWRTFSTKSIDRASVTPR